MALGTAVLLGLSLIAAGVILLVVALRSRNGRLPRNWVVGIRTKATLADNVLWVRAQQAAAGSLLAGSVGTMLAGAVVLLRPSNGMGVGVTACGVAWLLFFVIRGTVLANRAATDSA